MMNVALCGIGRAGAEVVKTAGNSGKFNITAAFCRSNSEKKGKDIGLLSQTGEMGIKAMAITEAEEVFACTPVDVAIDFSNPVSSRMLLNACRMHGIPCVVCTTGFSEEEVGWMSKLAWTNKLGIVYAPNVTLGINVLMALLKTVTRALPYFDYQITEIHHNKKADKPSGTAKRIAEVIENELPDGAESPVPINSVRAGGYVGVHEVLAVGECERLSIVHETFSRSAFAQGALMAAQFIFHKKGWYYMEDVIDIGYMIKEEDISLNRA